MIIGDDRPTTAECLTQYGIDPATVADFKSYAVIDPSDDTKIGADAIPVGALYVCATNGDDADTDATELSTFIATHKTERGLRWYFFNKL